jgi:hemerythrin-like metal-binding protein
MQKRWLSLRSFAADLLARLRHGRTGDKTAGNPSPYTTLPGEQALAANLMNVRWRSSFECGHPVIDQQHRQLVNIGNELVAAVQARKAPREIELLLQELVEHIENHFATEEQILARTRYPLSGEHKKLHGQLLVQAAEIRDRYRAGHVALSEAVEFVFHEVVAVHILKEDLKFALQDR